MRNSKLILHIPHSSTVIPEVYRSIFMCPEELATTATSSADLYTDDLYRYPATSIIFPVSRLICDVERFRDPEDEAMSKLGMWICYTHDQNGQRIANYDNHHANEILTNYYDKHHAQLTNATAVKLQTFNQALIVDCHSFPLVLPYYPSGNLPDICLGQDEYHTPSKLIELCCRYFEAQGYTVAINHPFKGSLVPLTYYQKDKRVQSIMLEVSRKLYCDENNRKIPGYNRLKTTLQNLLQILEKV